MKADDSLSKNNSWIVVAVSIVLWFVSVLSSTSIGRTYKVYETTMLVALVCYIYQILVKGQFSRIKKSTIIIIFVILLQNLYTHLIYGRDFIAYLEIYTIPILYSLFKLDEEQMHKIGLIYGVLGGAVLAAANFTNYFSGWDGNSVSIICFFSYTVFISSLFDIKKKEHQQSIVIYSIIYFILLWTLNSRSCMLFSAFLLLCELGIIPARRVINKKNMLTWLLIPLIIAITVAIVSYPSVLASLNDWSRAYFNKSLYSGRDIMWVEGFSQWSKHPILGTGTLAVRWHNSAISCLICAGCLGYFIWIYAIRAMLVKACTYINDNIIFGTVTSFLAVWLQQSVELGIITKYGNTIIFVLLGLILARTNTLEREEHMEETGE